MKGTETISIDVRDTCNVPSDFEVMSHMINRANELGLQKKKITSIESNVEIGPTLERGIEITIKWIKGGR